MDHPDRIETLPYQAIVDGSDRPIISRTSDGKIIQANASATAMFGFTVETAKGLAWQALVPMVTVNADPGKKGDAEGIEVEVKDVLGQLRRLTLTERRFTDPDGRELITAYFHDVTSLCQIMDSYLGTMVSLQDEIQHRQEVERSLRVIERNFKRAQAIAEIGSWEVSLRGRRVYISDEAFRLLGQPNSVTGVAGLVALNKTLSPKHRRHLRNLMRRAVYHGQGFEAEIDIADPDGSARSLRILAKVKPDTTADTDPRPIIIGTVQDISRERRAERSLRESEERYRSLFEGNSVPELLLDPQTGEILDANPAAVQFYGFPLEELTAKTIPDISLQDRSEIEAEVAQAKLEQRSHFFFRHRLASGEIRDVEVHSGPVTLHGRRLIFSVIHDVTERKRAEEQLKLLSAAVSQSSTLVSITNAQNRITYVNPAFRLTTGYGDADVLGKQPAELRGAHNPPDLVTNIWALLQQGEAWRGEYLLAKRDGSEFWVSAVISPVTDDAGIITHFVSVEDDISDRKRAEDRLRLAGTVFQATSEAIMVTDPYNRIQAVNHAFTKVTGYERDEVLGFTPRVLSSGHHDKAFYDALFQSLSETNQWSGEIWNRRKNGEIYPEWLSITAVRDEEGQLQSHVAVFNDISQRKAAEEQVRWQATHDALTELPNRALFMDRLEQGVRAAERSGSRFALAFLDLDRFKQVNDTHGHASGDSLLRQAADRLRETIRESDTAARLAGDEFTIILPDLPDALDAQRVARKLVSAMRKPFTLAPTGVTVEISTSIGIAVYPEDGATADELMRSADAGMYAAKRTGRNGYRFHRPELNQHLNHQVALEAELSRALEQGDLHVVYQPVLSLDGKRLFAIEVMIRWKHGERGILLSSEFIGQVRDLDLLERVSEFILTTAIKDPTLRALDLRPLLTMNISARSLRDDHLPRLVRRLSAQSKGWPAQRIGFELQEPKISNALAHGAATLAELEKLGTGVILEDFGAGDASMMQVTRLPVKLLKLSSQLTNSMTISRDSKAMVEAITAWASALHIPVCGMSIDRTEHFDAIRETEISYIQGRTLAAPMDSAAFKEFLDLQWLEIE